MQRHRFRNTFFTANVILFFSFSISAIAGRTYTTVSKSGDNWTLGFEEDAVTTETQEAVFCGTRQISIEAAQLWMPSMGHGTSPVSLAPVSNGCTAIRDINLLMQGVWELRIKLISGDFGVFKFVVR